MSTATETTILNLTRQTWISGVLGSSKSDSTLCYVRTETSNVIEALRGEPDVCLCQGEAVSKLISAAPDLYKALYGFLEAMKNSEDGEIYFGYEISEAVRALKKARGES